MPSFFRRTAAFLLLACCSAAHGQSIGYYIPRVYGPGPLMIRDEPFSHRYNNYAGPALYLNGDARQMWYLDWLDRCDRAERLGYPPPPWPRQLSSRPPCCKPSVTFGAGVYAPVRSR